jgi:hypothetical protein
MAVWQRKKKNIFVEVSHLSDDQIVIYYYRISGKKGRGRLVFRDRKDFLEKYKLVEYGLN